MGGGESQPTSPPPPPSPPRPPPTSPPSPLLDQPWRTLPEDKQEDLTFVKSYKPLKKGAKHIRILLHGPNGAGKSSFINSVDSVLQGRIAGQAPTDAVSGTSYTKKYKTYRIQNGPDNFYSFIFNDTMGFEKDTNAGVLVEDVELALRGHVEEDYKFSPTQKLMEGANGYRSSPTLDDKVHVLVCVLPAGSVSLNSDEVVKKMREVRLAASEMGIPQLAILTKVDEACAKTDKNIKDAYKSTYLKKQVDIFNSLLGIPKDCIFLMKNYGTDPNMNDDKNALILSALRQMITFGEDFLTNLNKLPDTCQVCCLPGLSRPFSLTRLFSDEQL